MIFITITIYILNLTRECVRAEVDFISFRFMSSQARLFRAICRDMCSSLNEMLWSSLQLYRDFFCITLHYNVVTAVLYSFLHEMTLPYIDADAFI